MTSDRKLSSNRRNAAKSTGPKSDIASGDHDAMPSVTGSQFRPTLILPSMTTSVRLRGSLPLLAERMMSPRPRASRLKHKSRFFE